MDTCRNSIGRALQIHASHYFCPSVHVACFVPEKIVDSDNSPKVVVTRSEFVLEDNKLQADIVYTPRSQQEKRINRASQVPYLLSTGPLPPTISEKSKKKARNKRLLNFVHFVRKDAQNHFME